MLYLSRRSPWPAAVRRLRDESGSAKAEQITSFASALRPPRLK